MARYLKKTWPPQTAGSAPRSQRQPCQYEPYLPDPLANRTFRFDGSVAADIADAESAIARLDTRAGALADSEALARILLRAESVASSRIEGLAIGPRRLLRAEAAAEMNIPVDDVNAEDVLGNIRAMRAAIDLAAGDAPMSSDHILEIHRLLLERTRMASYAGRVRTEQNWIGGSNYNPCSASFVPPPADRVMALLDDLCAFCNSDDLPAVAQAAIAHAQFETIHPFVDGNGRTGRALIYLVLRRRGLALNTLPPISLVLASRPRDYLGGLAAFRHIGAPSGAGAIRGVNEWVATFASACLVAVDHAAQFEVRCTEIEARWRGRLGKVRTSSTVDLLLRSLPGMPIVSVNSVAAALGRSKPQINGAIARLEEAGVLTQVTVGRRNRAFEAREIIDAITNLERQLTTGEML